MPAGAEDALVGRVPEDVQAVHRRDPLRGGVNHHHLGLVGLEVAGDRSAHPTPPTEDHVIVQRRDLLFHSAPPKVAAEIALDKELNQDAEGVGGGAHAEQHQDDGEPLLALGEAVGGAEADRRHRRYGLEQGVQDPVAKGDVTDRAGGHHEDHRPEAGGQPSCGGKTGVWALRLPVPGAAPAPAPASLFAHARGEDARAMVDTVR